MDRKYTSLENKIRNVVRGTTGATQDNRSLESKIRSVVLNEEVEFDEALGTGGNEGGEFKGIPPAFFKSVHIEPKVGDAHPPAEGAAAASRNRAKIASSETMKKEGYIITLSGRKPLINEADLEEGSEKFAKIMARTAAARGEPITTDTTELEKKHAELLQTSRDAADRAKQARTDYETLAKKYGITPEPIGEEVELDEADGIGGAVLQYAPKILPEIGAGVKTVVKKLEQWSPPGFGAKVEKGAGSTELALPSPKTVTAPAKAPDISFQPPVAKTGTDVATPGQSSMPKPNAKVDIPNAVGPTVTPPKIATPKPTIFAKPKNVTEPVTKPGVSPKPGSVPKAGGGRIAKGAAGAGAAAGIADFLFGGSGGAAIPNNNDSAPAGDRIDLSRNRHYAKARQVYGQEIHYNEYEPDGDYIGEDSAEQTDAERSAIENVARPNSKNKLTKQAEIQRKIIEDTQRRKGVIKSILKAKEENKNGKDGANSGVETKPELKRVDVNEIVATVGKTILKGLGVNTGLGVGIGGATGALEKGTPGIVPGMKQGIEDMFPGSRDAYRDFKAGNYGQAALGAGKALARGTAGALPYITPVTAGISLGMSPSSAASEDELEFERRNNAEMDAKNPSRVMPAGTPEGTVTTPKPNNVGAVGGAAAGRVITQSSKPGSVGGAAAGKAITKVAPAPKPRQSDPAVLKIQQDLIAKGAKIKADGIMGSQTRAAQADARPAKSAAGSDYENARTAQLRANPNSVGARSALPPEARGEAPLPVAPVKAQPSPGINSTNNEAPRSMGSSFNNSYKNKYSMGPGPSQFPSK